MGMTDELRRARVAVAPAVQRTPVLGPAAMAVFVRRRFRVERALLRGRSVSRSSHPSVLHFSVNKAATQYTRRLLVRCGEGTGLVPVNLNGHAFWTDRPFLDHLSAAEMADHAAAFRPTGHLYSVFGGLVQAIPERGRYRTVLQVRDPRDVLTSQYFSIAYSHQQPGPAKRDEFLARRDQALAVGIDRFVIDRLPRVQEIFEAYVPLLDEPGVLVTTYERLIGDFEGWLDQICGFCGFAPSSATRDALVGEAYASAQAGGNPMHKRRQVTPGDHRRQLAPDTVAALDEQLAPVLERFGYPVV